jgi:hypothetical protein
MEGKAAWAAFKIGGATIIKKGIWFMNVQIVHIYAAIIGSFSPPPGTRKY